MADIISICFEGLNRYLKDVKKSSLVYICARSGMGLQTFVKLFKKEFNFLDICTVQMSDYEGKPTLKDLLKIGSVVQDADIIMFLHRDDFTSNNMDNVDPGVTELIVAKNRYGDTGVINLKYNYETKQFTETDD